MLTRQTWLCRPVDIALRLTYLDMLLPMALCHMGWDCLCDAAV